MCVLVLCSSTSRLAIHPETVCLKPLQICWNLDRGRFWQRCAVCSDIARSGLRSHSCIASVAKKHSPFHMPLQITTPSSVPSASPPPPLPTPAPPPLRPPALPPPALARASGGLGGLGAAPLCTSHLSPLSTPRPTAAQHPKGLGVGELHPPPARPTSAPYVPPNPAPETWRFLAGRNSGP